MLFLPLPDRLGVFRVAEIIFVSRFGQPGALVSPLPGLLTIDLGTKALSLPLPVIGKKKSVAVRAFTAALLGLHRFENQTDQSEENSDERGRKSRRKKTQKGEEGRRLFSESFEENAAEEDPFLNRPFCGNFNPPLAHKSRTFGYLAQISARSRSRPPRADRKRFWKVPVLHLVLGFCWRA